MSATENDVRVERQGGILRLILNRPQERNTIVPGMIDRLIDGVDGAMADPAVAVLIVEGAGSDFCAGGSLSALAASGEREVALTLRQDRALQAARLTQLLASGPKPTMAKLRGAVAGGGLAIAAACDVRVASDNARFSFAYSRIGLSGDIGATLHLTRLLGARMREFALLSPVLGADEAVALGLVGRVVGDDALDSEARSLAERLADLLPQAAAGLKQNIRAALELGEEAALAIEAENFARCQNDPDQKEAARAFLEKRRPRYSRSRPPVTAPWPAQRDQS